MSHTDMALINTKCEDNIELRKLVTETIRNYEEGQNENAQAAGVSVKRKFEPEEAENVFVARFCGPNLVIANWSTKLTREAVRHMDPALISKSFASELGRGTCLELIENGGEVKCFGEQPDKVFTDNKKDVFEKLKTTYEAVGKPWSSLVWTGHQVDWNLPQNGQFQMKLLDGSIEIYCKMIRKTCIIPEEVLSGDRGPFEGPYENFSLYRAYIKSPIDNYLLYTLFPRLSRSLRRRISEETGLISDGIAEDACVRVVV